MISIIIPAKNEAKTIGRTLEQFIGIPDLEIILVDGQSSDETVLIAQSYTNLPIHIISQEGGRGYSIAAGMEQAQGDLVLVVHADTILPTNWIEGVKRSLADQYVGGAFAITFVPSPSWAYRTINRYSNWRAKLTGMYHGDQAMFIDRQYIPSLLEHIRIPLMEDVRWSEYMRACGKTKFLSGPAQTSSRRISYNGVIKSIFLYMIIKFLYAVGVSPQKLHKIYTQIQK
jgi:rSAM/selenodomain-associated transferase 2